MILTLTILMYKEKNDQQCAKERSGFDKHGVQQEKNQRLSTTRRVTTTR